MKFNVEFDIPVPEGYEPEPKARVPQEGELWTCGDGNVFKVSYGGQETRPRIILRKVTPPRWRAEKGAAYWFVWCDGGVLQDTEHWLGMDNDRYISGNYFRTAELAEAAAKASRELWLGLEHGENAQ